MDGGNKTHDVLVGQDGAALAAAAHAADVAHLHGEMNTRCDTNRPSPAVGRAGTNLQADRQQGGPDYARLRPAGGLLAGLLSLLCRSLLLLAAVQQHRLDAVSISQEEGVVLTGRHAPNPKTIGQLGSGRSVVDHSTKQFSFKRPKSGKTNAPLPGGVR